MRSVSFDSWRLRTSRNAVTKEFQVNGAFSALKYVRSDETVPGNKFDRSVVVVAAVIYEFDFNLLELWSFRFIGPSSNDAVAQANPTFVTMSFRVRIKQRCKVILRRIDPYRIHMSLKSLNVDLIDVAVHQLKREVLVVVAASNQLKDNREPPQKKIVLLAHLANLPQQKTRRYQRTNRSGPSTKGTYPSTYALGTCFSCRERNCSATNGRESRYGNRYQNASGNKNSNYISAALADRAQNRFHTNLLNGGKFLQCFINFGKGRALS